MALSAPAPPYEGETMTQQPAQQHNPFTTPQSEVAPAKTHVLAVVGFVLALLPIMGVNLVGIILGAIAWSQINAKPKELKGKGLAMAAVFVGAGWMFIMVLGI